MELSSPPFSVAFEQGIPASISNLRGIWYLVGSSALISFARDGTYAYDDNGTLDTNPLDSGTYEAADSSLTLTSGSDSLTCKAGDILAVENVKFLYPEWWVIGKVTQDSCGRLQPGEIFLKAVSI
jgi:hypothetical protein